MTCYIVYIKALASARGSEKKILKKSEKKSKKSCQCLSIYVFVDSKQKAEFKAKIKPCSHLLNCMKLSELNEAGNALRIPKIYRNLSLRFSFFEIF